MQRNYHPSLALVFTDDGGTKDATNIEVRHLAKKPNVCLHYIFSAKV